MMIRRFAVLIGICFLTATPLRAQSAMPPLARQAFVAANDYPWSGVGKLNNSGYGFCSAVLVSPKYALTAAHCLLFRSTGKFFPAQAFHLVFGYDRGAFRDNLHIAAFYVPPGYDPQRPQETLADDWALLLIDGKPHARPLDIARRIDSDVVLKFVTAGYSRLIPHRMTADRHCRLVGRTKNKAILFDSCNAPEGFSGGPVLVENADDHSFAVAGIHVAKESWQGATVTAAVSTEAIWRAIKPCVVNDECQFQYVATGRDPTAAELLSGLPNLNLASSVSCSVSDPACPRPPAARPPAAAGKIKAPPAARLHELSAPRP
jgi:protease YdgD